MTFQNSNTSLGPSDQTHEPVGGKSYLKHNRYLPDSTVAVLMVCKTGTEENSLRSLKGTLWQQRLWAFRVIDREFSKLGSDGHRLSSAHISRCLVAITHAVRRGRREMHLHWEDPLMLSSLADDRRANLEDPCRNAMGLPHVRVS